MCHKKNILNRMMGLSLLASLGLVAFLSLAQSNAALAATAPDLGLLSTYAVVSSTFTNANNPGPPPLTALIGTPGLPVLCYTSGTAPLTIVGTTNVACPPSLGGVGGAETKALADLNAQALATSCKFIPAGTPLEAVVIPGHAAGTYPPGCYRFGGAMNLTASTIMTLDGDGVYIFSSVGALNTESDSSITLKNGACASNVYWAPGGGATIGAYTIGGIPAATPTFEGTIIDPAGITVGNFANVEGRLIDFETTVTTAADTITVPTCAPIPPPAKSVPTLNEWGVIFFMVLAGLGSVYYLRKQIRAIS